MADMIATIHSVVRRLHKIGETIGNSISAADVHHLADEVQAKLEAWHEAVDAWIENTADPELEKARREAFAAFRSAVQRAHVVLGDLKS